MSEIIKDIIDFYGVRPIAFRKCPNCDKSIEIKLETVSEKMSKQTLPWVLFFKELYRLPSLECCGTQYYPSHIRLRPTDDVLKQNPQLEELFHGQDHQYQVGTNKVPVISDESLNFPIIRSYEEQMIIHKQIKQQNRLLSRKQDEFYNTCYSYFSIHFEQIIQEIDGEEILDVLDAMMNTQYGFHLKDLKAPVKVNRKDKKAYLNWVKKQIRLIAEKHADEGKQMTFYLIVKYFVEWELIQGIYYLRWNIEKYEKMIGKTLLLYMVLQFPLTNYFSYLREEAILKLTSTRKNHRKKYEIVNVIQNDLDKANQKIDKLQQTIERQRETILLLESKVASYEYRNDQLNKELLMKEEELPNVLSQSRKIKGLKGIIESLRYELQTFKEDSSNENEQKPTLNDESRTETPFEDDIETGTESNYEHLQVEVDDLAVLNGKIVGIFGDIQFSQEQLEAFPFSIITTSTVQNVEGVGVLNKSDVCVVLTQHISHPCMWAIKEHAYAKGIPVLFSRHTNLRIILNQAAQLFQ